MKKWIKLMKLHRKQMIFYSLIALAIIILVALFFNVVKAIVVILLFVIFNCFLRFYKRIFIGIPIEFEITILGAVIVTIAYGFWAGLMVALFSAIFAEFFNQFISPFSLVNITAYILVPVGALLLGPGTIVTGGFIIVIIVNILIYIVFIVMGYDLFRNTGYAVTNIVFNYFLFTYISKPLLNIIM